MKKGTIDDTTRYCKKCKSEETFIEDKNESNIITTMATCLLCNQALMQCTKCRANDYHSIQANIHTRTFKVIGQRFKICKPCESKHTKVVGLKFYQMIREKTNAYILINLDTSTVFITDKAIQDFNLKFVPLCWPCFKIDEYIDKSTINDSKVFFVDIPCNQHKSSKAEDKNDRKRLRDDIRKKKLDLIEARAKLSDSSPKWKSYYQEQTLKRTLKRIKRNETTEGDIEQDIDRARLRRLQRRGAIDLEHFLRQLTKQEATGEATGDVEQEATEETTKEAEQVTITGVTV